MPDIEKDLIPDIEYVVYRECTAAWHLSKHEFPICDTTYIIKGGARYIINGAAYDVSAGDLLCLPPGTVRAGFTFPDRLMHCFSVNFYLHNSTGNPVRLPFPIVRHIGNKEDIIHLLHDLSSVWLDRQPGYEIKLRGLFLLVLHRFFEIIVYNKDPSTMDFRVAKAIRYLSSHYPEKISVSKIAGMVKLNPHYFGALFKQETGLTLNRYVIRTRVRKAENLLSSGEYKVGDVADVCGFTDVAHLYRQFKEVMGYPPSGCIPKKTCPDSPGCQPTEAAAPPGAAALAKKRAPLLRIR
ncbi:MAG: AraC family transcriptional regulator [Spirochaetaceae bacterium]|jgi:AraC-like DNA-binding protein|nr:AraC family transcriptional regulator [Spirochaetaceae bacterium]